MTQVEDQASQAEERSQETRSFVRQVRAATRRKYTPEEKIRIVLEGFRRETTVNDLCRREGIPSGPHHQDSGEAKIRESTAGVSRKPSSDGKARGSSSKHLCGLTAWNT